MGTPEVTQTFAVKANLLSNGGFEKPMAPWQFLLSNDGKVAAGASIDTTKFAGGVSSLLVTVTSAATSAWHVDVEQQNLPVTAGVTYEVQFWAIANATRTMNVILQGAAPNYTNHGLNASVTVRTTWQPYTLHFRRPGECCGRSFGILVRRVGGQRACGRGTVLRAVGIEKGDNRHRAVPCALRFVEGHSSLDRPGKLRPPCERACVR